VGCYLEGQHTVITKNASSQGNHKSKKADTRGTPPILGVAHNLLATDAQQLPPARHVIYLTNHYSSKRLEFLERVTA
jgi:hypothetical protein